MQIGLGNLAAQKGQQRLQIGKLVNLLGDGRLHRAVPVRLPTLLPKTDQERVIVGTIWTVSRSVSRVVSGLRLIGLIRAIRVLRLRRVR